ncbi:hypothetical protein CERSUDRAFT_89938 [Gelatoporia subvermispora B]|uniref:Uncharacterized protein n=1 Tax=Ceriporiopsis subvermispora (strain B) TaxID=914234 RepID=M2QWA6_CERS8|nr:hypothetical protein CERSUDRAFT_89938 [Gelatoporia subvermispora B]
MFLRAKVPRRRRNLNALRVCHSRHLRTQTRHNCSLIAHITPLRRAIGRVPGLHPPPPPPPSAGHGQIAQMASTPPPRRALSALPPEPGHPAHHPAARIAAPSCLMRAAAGLLLRIAGARPGRDAGGSVLCPVSTCEARARGTPGGPWRASPGGFEAFAGGDAAKGLIIIVAGNA